MAIIKAAAVLQHRFSRRSVFKLLWYALGVLSSHAPEKKDLAYTYLPVELVELEKVQ